MKIVGFLAAAILIIACNKSDDEPTDQQRIDLLTEKKWQIVSNKSIDSMMRETDLYSQLEPYKKDDYLIFNKDSTYELNDNIELESDSTSRILDSGHWRFNEDFSQLLRSSDMYVRDYEPATITTLTETTLVIQSDFSSDRSSIITEYRNIP